jgi:hypothetical protein
MPFYEGLKAALSPMARQILRISINFSSYFSDIMQTHVNVFIPILCVPNYTSSPMKDSNE